MPRPLTGLWPPACTPFTADGAIDEKRFVAHARRLLADGAEGLAVLGTTSEANSLTMAERKRAVDLLIEAGIPADRLLPGTGGCALGDVVELSRYASDKGCAAVLVLPPFYFKNVNDDGIFNFFAELIGRLGSAAPRMLLYHIPPQAVIGFSLELIGRLRKEFPEVVVGLKDSSNNWDNTRSIIEAFPGFAVFPGSESNAVKAIRLGAAGCITASGNANAKNLARLLKIARTDEAEALQAEVNGVRSAIEKHGLMQATKAVLAARYKDDNWLRLRVPLLPITPEVRKSLLADPSIVKLLAE
jgi:4-hydroxy-tetrahydrodipicolinate synthase